MVRHARNLNLSVVIALDIGLLTLRAGAQEVPADSITVEQAIDTTSELASSLDDVVVTAAPTVEGNRIQLAFEQGLAKLQDSLVLLEDVLAGNASPQVQMDVLGMVSLQISQLYALAQEGNLAIPRDVVELAQRVAQFEPDDLE